MKKYIKIKYYLVIVILNFSSAFFFAQSWADYLNPSDTTISTTDSLTIYGRIKLSDIPSEYGLDTNYIAKLLINKTGGRDPRFEQVLVVNAVYDKHIDSSKQYKAYIKDISSGNYVFCYGYYLNDKLIWAGGVPNDGNYFISGKLSVTSPTSIKNTSNIFRIKLFPNYPNPFNPTTVIKYQIPNINNQNSNIISLKVYDVLGKEVATLVNKQQPAGKYKVTFNGSNLPSGVYFYRLQSGDFVETKKLLLLK